MATKNFELFGACFGNGTTLYNKAVTSGGDFKKIGHISPAGRIVFLDPKNYGGAGCEIPDEAMKKICEWSEAAEKNFKASWYQLPDLNRYEIMLDTIPAQALLDHPLKETLKACTDLREKVVLLEQIYFKDYA